MPRLSIVIACPNDSEPFETTLASVLQHRPVDCEVIVVHPFAYADPYELAAEVRFVNAGPQPGVLGLMNAGLAAARGEIVHLVEGGLEVEEGWADTALSGFDDPRVATVAPLVVLRSDQQRIAWTGVGYAGSGARRLYGTGRANADQVRSGDRILGPARMAGFYRTDLLRELGGFDPDMGDHCADVDMALTIQDLGLLCHRAADSKLRATQLPAKPEPSFAAGMQVERLFWRHAATHGWVASLLTHPLAVTAQAIGQLPRIGLLLHLAGRLVACFDPSAGRHYQRRLQRARASLRRKTEAVEESGHQRREDDRQPKGRRAA